MRPPESFIGQPIRSLQTMLQVIAKNDPSYVPMIPDGIYGPETVRAVTAFQRAQGLPATGVTDQNTWEAVVSAYEPALIERAEAQAVNIILNPGQVLSLGQQAPYVYLVQAMLQVLYDAYKSVPQPNHSGVLDEATANSLALFQALCALPVTGTLDKRTWKHLALQYTLAANLHAYPARPAVR